MKVGVYLLVVGASAILLAAWNMRRRAKTMGTISLIVLCLSLAAWSLARLLSERLFPAKAAPLSVAILLLAATTAASAQFAFSFSYSKRYPGSVRSLLLLIGAFPLLVQILFWSEPWHTALFTDTVQPLLFFQPLPKPGFRIVTVYIYGLAGASALLVMDALVQRLRPFLAGSWIILASSILPLSALTLDVVVSPSTPPSGFSLLAFTLAACGFSYGLSQRGLVEPAPIRREAVVEGMDEGWMVLDSQNNIVDINPAAERIIGLVREKVYGQPVTTILSDLPNLAPMLDSDRELEMKRSVKSQEGWRYINVRSSPLVDRNRRRIGRLIVWRDVTERKLVEDARQRARDELFVLLNAISSAASHTINLDEFLSESIYQIIYPFRSQGVAIFLFEEKGKKQESAAFLASHFGLAMEAVERMASMPISEPLFQWILNKRQPLLIDDMENDARLPQPLRMMEFSCLLAAPLITQAGDESKVLGCICLARKGRPLFSQDEMVRLNTISDHMANLVDSDRRRKLAISLSERRQLVRDLHDSVSQKLYGLVTLTEAAQAALEAGSTVNPSQILARIGENARQAVKEMRLFLYQMQPVDIDKEGLLSALHHRLAAVEGRADIKARFLADENISLSKEKEIALYFIAQEALNNALRHAHAKSVTITLQQGRRNVILKIQDDGRGFDPRKVERGGLGLQNMKERAWQIGGKIQILSRPQQGTKIVVHVPKEAAQPPQSRRQI